MILYALVAFLGCLFGYLIANYTKDELKTGNIYFRLLEIVILVLMLSFSVFINFNLWLFIFGFLIAFILKLEYFYFGILLFSINNFLFFGLIFIYGLAYGTLAYSSKSWKIFIFSFIAFLIAFLFSFLDFSFLSFASGGFLGLAVLKIAKLVDFNH